MTGSVLVLGSTRRRILGSSGPGVAALTALAVLSACGSSPAPSSTPTGPKGAGVVKTYSDPSISGPNGITAGPDGALWFTNSANNSIGRITTGGRVTNYR